MEIKRDSNFDRGSFGYLHVVHPKTKYIDNIDKIPGRWGSVPAKIAVADGPEFTPVRVEIVETKWLNAGKVYLVSGYLDGQRFDVEALQLKQARVTAEAIVHSYYAGKAAACSESSSDS